MPWKFRGHERPPFAARPDSGDESVWDYPRPPIIVPDHRCVEVRIDDTVIASSTRSLRLLETASAPGFYLPLADVRVELLQPVDHISVCEWKGMAQYFDLSVDGNSIPLVAWRYPKPPEAYAAIADCVSFYPNKVECYVDTERARPQPGGFYGGWLTSEIVGPVKGAPGTAGW
jgi:uncharacterized protein (DUF427 family)